MRRYLIAFGILALLLIPAAAVAADQIELTKRETSSGVETIFLDDAKNEVTILLDGTPVATRPATPREIEAVDRKTAAQERSAALETVATVIADMKARPSSNPDVQRVETAIQAITEALGIE